MKDYFVYIIECCNGSLYTGYTVDIDKRFNEHLDGRDGAKFTKAFKPKRVAASWKIHGERGEAMHIEAFIKSLKKDQKTAITADPESLIDLLNTVEKSGCDVTVFDHSASMFPEIREK